MLCCTPGVIGLPPWYCPCLLSMWKRTCVPLLSAQLNDWLSDWSAMHPSTISLIAWLKIITILKRLNRLFREQHTFYNQMLSEMMSILSHFIPSGPIVDYVAAVFRPHTTLSGLEHMRPCGPPTWPSETSGCILWRCKLLSSVGINSCGVQPDSCNHKSTQSNFVECTNLTKGLHRLLLDKVWNEVRIF